MKNKRIFFSLYGFYLLSMLLGKANAQALTDLKPILDAQIGQSVIEIPPGTYLLNNAAHRFYHFADLEDVEIRGNGARIICNSQEQAFRFSNCKRVTVKDLSIDYDPLCFTQGKIIAKASNSSWFEVEIDDGYPIENITTSKVNFYDPVTRELKRNSITSYTGNYTAINDLGDRKFRLVKNGIWTGNEELGDLVTLDVKANKSSIIPHTIHLDKCEDMLLEDITVFGSNTFSFYERECSATHYNRCKVAKGESPAGISPRLRSGNADGIHSSLSKIGPTIENCEVGYNGDDCIVIAGRSFPICKIDSIEKRIYVLSADANPAFYNQDTLQHVLYNGIKAGTMKILSLVKFTPGTEEANFIQEKCPNLLSPNSYTTGIRISVEDLPENIAVGDIVYNQNYMGKGFEIRNNKVKSTRSRGILIKGSHGVVIDNEISNCAMNGILVAPEIRWMGGGFSDSIEVKGNVITNCMFERTNSAMAPGSLSVFYANFLNEIPPTAGAFSNIIVKDNVISESPYPGLVFTSVSQLNYDNNQVIPDPTNTRGHGANYGVIFTEPIWEKNNTYAAPNHFTADNLILVRVGDGVSALGSTSAPVFFDEYKTDGTFVQSIPLRTSVDGVQKRLTLSGDKTDEGYISLSPDGDKVALFGYDCDPGTLSPSGATSAAVNRVIGVLTADKSVNTTKFINNMFSGVVARSAAVSGDNLWVTGGGSGIVHTTYNSTGAGTTNTTLTSTTGRVLSIYNGQLYASSIGAYRMGKVGTGIPVTTGQTITSLPGYPTANPDNPFQYVFADQNTTIPGVDVLYVADATRGLLKYSLDGTTSTWVHNGTVTGSYMGLTGRKVGSSMVLYGTRNIGSNTFQLFTIADSGGHNASFSSTTVTGLSTAGSNTVFRGIAFTPGTDVLPVSMGQFNGKIGKDKVLLEWETYSEQRNSHFEILRSHSGDNFNKIGEVKGAGNSNSRHQYSYEDKIPLAGNNYYRLRQVDTDGAYSETDVIVVKQGEKPTELQVYATEGILRARLYSSIAGPGKLSVYDISGKRLYEESLDLVSGYQDHLLGSGYHSGIYIVVFSNSKEAVSQKLIL